MLTFRIADLFWLTLTVGLACAPVAMGRPLLAPVALSPGLLAWMLTWESDSRWAAACYVLAYAGTLAAIAMGAVLLCSSRL